MASIQSAPKGMGWSPLSRSRVQVTEKVKRRGPKRGGVCGQAAGVSTPASHTLNGTFGSGWSTGRWSLPEFGWFSSLGKARVASLTGWEWRLRSVAFICGEGTGARLSWRRLVGAQGDGLVTTLAQRHGTARHNDDSALWVQRVRGVACGNGPSVFGSGAGRQAGGLSLVTCTGMMGTVWLVRRRSCSSAGRGTAVGPHHFLSTSARQLGLWVSCDRTGEGGIWVMRVPKVLGPPGTGPGGGGSVSSGAALWARAIWSGLNGAWHGRKVGRNGDGRSV